MREKCVICGEYEEKHHTFEPPKRPSSTCCCDAISWGNHLEIPPVCFRFIGDPNSNCEACEHDYKCHETNEHTAPPRLQ